MFKLPEGMERVWLMRARGGMREVDIAETLGISRQAVNKALKDARVKLFEAFFSIAETFSWDVVRVNAEKGGFAVFSGKVLGKRVRVYAFYLPGKGGIKAFFGEDIPDYILQHAVEVGIIEKPEKEGGLIKALES
ncbi:sigma factor-like helix-turn-helix DNA-binding protein [Thermococcus sp. JCM 11816]|uniref:sigma-70 region 4 domain-containing protein n=1 Tax=Thermococcus sp. (strain JCM 11816 / KS-1) TaxID=1295125 RepID=UPI0006CFFFBF